MNRRYKVTYKIAADNARGYLTRTKTVTARHDGRAMDMVEQSIKGAVAVSARPVGAHERASRY